MTQKTAAKKKAPAKTAAKTQAKKAEPVIEVTLEQASNFYALMVEFKLDEMIDAVAHARSSAPTGGVQVVTAKDQAAMAKGEKQLSEDEHADALTLAIDMGHIFRTIAKEGGMFKLGAIVLDCTEDEAKKRTTQELQTQLVPFLRESIAPLQTLLGFVGALA